MTCEWCGGEHGVRDLCRARPRWGRRGFLAMLGVGLVGAALDPKALLAPKVRSFVIDGIDLSSHVVSCKITYESVIVPWNNVAKVWNAEVQFSHDVIRWDDEVEREIGRLVSPRFAVVDGVVE